MLGYSKMVGYTEPIDKGTCLFNMHFRLWEQGYMREGKHLNTRGTLIMPVEYMAYYRNHTNVPVYFFFPTHAEPQMGYEWPIRFVEKIDSFYQDMLSGASLADLRNKYYVSRTKAALVQDQFDLTRPRFYSDIALRGYADGLRKKNVPGKLIEDFVAKYSQKFFINGRIDPKIVEEYRTQFNHSQHAQRVNEADGVSASKAREFQQNLANKFSSNRS